MGIVRTDGKAIGGKLYKSKTFTTTGGLEIMSKLSLVFGDSIGILLAQRKDGAFDLDIAVIGQILTEVARSATAAKKEFGSNPLLVLRDLLVNTTVDDVNVGDLKNVTMSCHTAFDSHFAGDYKHLIEVCLWVGSLNFMPPSAAKG